MSVCVCVFAIRARVSCSIALKLAVVSGGHRGSGYSGVHTPRLAVPTESYPSISAFSFADDGHFLIIVTDFWFLPVDSLSSYVRI